MFRTKPVSYNVTTTLKLPKTNNVPFNVITIVTTCSQHSKQHVFKERELIKAKGVEDWQQKKTSMRFIHWNCQIITTWWD